MLFTSEYGLRGLVFEGEVYGMAEGWPLPDGDGTFALVLLLAGLLSVERLGGNRSAGFGACTCEVTALEVDGRAATVETYLNRLEEFILYEDTREEG